MSVSPEFDAFAASTTRASRNSSGPSWSPTSRRRSRPISSWPTAGANSFLLESVEGGSVRGRYSIIGFKPDVIWRCTRNKAEINRRARADAHAFEPLDGRPLETLRTLIRECQMELPTGLPPMASGLFGFLGYDMVRDMERLPDENPDPIGLPDAIMVRPTLICIFDRLEDNVTLVTPVWPQPGTSAPRRLRGGAGAAGRRGVRLRALPALPPRERRCAGGPARAAGQHDARTSSRRWSRPARNTSARATPSRSCRRSASRCPSSCRRCRSTARCAGSIRRRS